MGNPLMQDDTTLPAPHRVRRSPGSVVVHAIAGNIDDAPRPAIGFRIEQRQSKGSRPR